MMNKELDKLEDMLFDADMNDWYEAVKAVRMRLKEAELCLKSIYNIDAKYIGTTKEDSVTVDELYNDIMDECEDYFKKYKGLK